ncbi:putative guanylyltransferase [Cryphonectria parasitica mycoreovirus 2 (C18)]|uniref:Putative guanylyltransferase n=1 Tax=Cryphonectria parasitica mycoreovirus 2 (C18) TaxID=404238 RepID=Q06FB8_9REOV|nr:putative guanylyltransferase [Cryphonectria parasitica mycoreovirus 2 (C18)]ABI93184.1 putative guanylyltransferase [Cryphonectria parasitica mycoreovirus 2 (C18)]
MYVHAPFDLTTLYVPLPDFLSLLVNDIPFHSIRITSLPDPFNRQKVIGYALSVRHILYEDLGFLGQGSLTVDVPSSDSSRIPIDPLVFLTEHFHSVLSRYHSFLRTRLTFLLEYQDAEIDRHAFVFLPGLRAMLDRHSVTIPPSAIPHIRLDVDSTVTVHDAMTTFASTTLMHLCQSKFSPNGALAVPRRTRLINCALSDLSPHIAGKFVSYLVKFLPINDKWLLPAIVSSSDQVCGFHPRHNIPWPHYFIFPDDRSLMFRQAYLIHQTSLHCSATTQAIRGPRKVEILQVNRSLPLSLCQLSVLCQIPVAKIDLTVRDVPGYKAVVERVWSDLKWKLSSAGTYHYFREINWNQCSYLEIGNTEDPPLSSIASYSLPDLSESVTRNVLARSSGISLTAEITPINVSAAALFGQYKPLQLQPPTMDVSQVFSFLDLGPVLSSRDQERQPVVLNSVLSFADFTTIPTPGSIMVEPSSVSSAPLYPYDLADMTPLGKAAFVALADSVGSRYRIVPLPGTSDSQLMVDTRDLLSLFESVATLDGRCVLSMSHYCLLNFVALHTRFQQGTMSMRLSSVRKCLIDVPCSTQIEHVIKSVALDEALHPSLTSDAVRAGGAVLSGWVLYWIDMTAAAQASRIGEIGAVIERIVSHCDGFVIMASFVSDALLSVFIRVLPPTYSLHIFRPYGAHSPHCATFVGAAHARPIVDAPRVRPGTSDFFSFHICVRIPPMSAHAEGATLPKILSLRAMATMIPTAFTFSCPGNVARDLVQIGAGFSSSGHVVKWLSNHGTEYWSGVFPQTPLRALASSTYAGGVSAHIPVLPHIALSQAAPVDLQGRYRCIDGYKYIYTVLPFFVEDVLQSRPSPRVVVDVGGRDGRWRAMFPNARYYIVDPEPCPPEACIYQLRDHDGQPLKWDFSNSVDFYHRYIKPVVAPAPEPDDDVLCLFSHVFPAALPDSGAILAAMRSVAAMPCNRLIIGNAPSYTEREYLACLTPPSVSRDLIFSGSKVLTNVYPSPPTSPALYQVFDAFPDGSTYTISAADALVVGRRFGCVPTPSAVSILDILCDLTYVIWVDA